MPKAHELRQARARLLDAANAIHERAEAENRSKTDAELADFTKAIDDAGALEVRAAEQERIDGLRSTADARGDRHGSPLPHNDLHNTRNGLHSYSLVKALRENLSHREGRGRLTGVEAETHQELEKRNGKSARGVMLPWDLAADPAREARAGVLNTTTGVGSIPTILAPTIIDLLRTRLVTRQAGATVMSDMQGLFAIPRQNAASTAQWVSEGGAPAASNQTIDQVMFSPRTVSAFTDYTRRFLEQTNQDAESFVRNDLMAVLARALDLAGLFGTGSGNQPLGIGTDPAIPVVSLGTNGAVPTYASMVSLETNVAVSNADVGTLSYIVNAKGRSTLKQTLKVSGSTFPVYLWENTGTGADGLPMGMVNGYRAFVSNQLPSNLAKGSGSNLSPVLFGNFADLIIALWSGIDTIVDPYTGSTTGSVRIACFQDADVNKRHPESFSNVLDMITS